MPTDVIAQATPAPTAPPPAAPVTPPPATLREFRAQKSAPVPETPAPVVEPPVPEAPIGEPPEPPDEQETPPAPDPAAVKPPEAAGHRWKDPDTGITLDLRRRDHRRIKKALEDRYALAQQVMRQPAPAVQPSPQAPQRPTEAKAAPTLEDFADQPDPYRAYMDAAIQHGIQEAVTKHEAQRTSVERTQRTQTAIASAQQAFDADLPSVRQRYPDFDAAHDELYSTLADFRQRGAGKRIEPIVHRLLTSEIKHDLAYYLGNHPEDLGRLVTARNPHAQGIELGLIEAQVKASLKTPTPAPPITPPAAPIAPTGGSASPVTLPDAKSITSLRQFRALKPKLGMRA